jgi:hypothetical protein
MRVGSQQAFAGAELRRIHANQEVMASQTGQGREE